MNTKIVWDENGTTKVAKGQIYNESEIDITVGSEESTITISKKHIISIRRYPDREDD